ncbi:hypothetical protein [Clostridium formicaceticum]|uniref:Uncharacterized protein n=1 Tax=Clostridium formicaceticum TaxID=1497 RepID=A0AAC9RLV1_9CLOT|nr:hypothetical protein [Clostridium formicaceticum]AOY76919.1 hypothetical protein BJL90_14275 [Clostridium formicaceticum]ARE87398.1 hypothetical protein CLFO_17980 [Clostridium formicaceticum]
MKKSIAIELDKIRNLRIGINAICQIEDFIGKSISSLQDGAGVKELRLMLFCGLNWEDKELTLERTGELMDEAIENNGIEYISEKLGEAIKLALPDKKKQMTLKK